MSQCDDLFQQIQDLENRKRQLAEDRATLASIDEGENARKFFFRGADGAKYEADFDQVFEQVTKHPQEFEDYARRAAREGFKPSGRDGLFENYRLMVERMGLEGAVQLGKELMGNTAAWRQLNPEDFTAVTAVYDKEKFAADMVNAFYEGRIDIEGDKVAQAIASNVTPFIGLEQRMVYLRAQTQMQLSILQKRIRMMREQMQATGVAPTAEAKRAFLDSYSATIYAHRSESLAKRKTGQVLQSLQRPVEGSESIEALIKAADERLKNEADELANKTLIATPSELVEEDSIAKHVVTSSDKGKDGIADLQKIEEAIAADGIGALDANEQKRWKNIYMRYARSGYKDSTLLNPKSQYWSNYVSAGMVFRAEGLRRMAGVNGWDLYGRRLKQATGAKEVYVNPLATMFMRDSWKAQIDGARIAWEARSKADAIIHQSWKESIQQGFFEAKTPFAGNSDHFYDQPNLSLEDQHKAAQAILAEPFSGDKGQFIYELRDKWHMAWKTWQSGIYERMTGSKLPIYPALQMMAAVDNRAGLRVFMTDRANDLMLEQASLYPDRTLKEWSDAVTQQLDDQLYKADPSPQNVADYRKQFGVEGKSDDEIKAAIVASRVGSPVVVTPGQQASALESIRQRMQLKPTDPFGKLVDNAMAPIRDTRFGDQMIPFWRSAWGDALYTMDLVTTGNKVAKATWNLAANRQITPEQAGQAQAAVVLWMGLLGVTLGLRSAGAIVGTGPLDLTRQRQWRERLRGEGKVPNSLGGVPFPMGGISVLGALFLMNDMMDVIEEGNVSKYDQLNAFNGLVRVGAGAILRQPSFRQVQDIYDALVQGDTNGFQRLASLTLNTVANPYSGPERLAEWAGGVGRSDLRPDVRMNSQSEMVALEQLPDSHPLKSIWNGLRSWTYNSNPGIAYFAGLRPRETTWLGRKVRRPDGIFRGEWPIGVPGIWEFNKGDYATEAWLEDLGQLDPPGPLMTGKLDGAYMPSALAEEYNSVLGTVKATTPRSRDSRFPDAVTIRGVDARRLFDQVTKGRNVREALEALRVSPQAAKWGRDPELTTDRSVRDMDPQERSNQPLSVMIKKVKDYYADLARYELEKSQTPEAIQWRTDRALLNPKPNPREERQSERNLLNTLR